MEDENLLYIYIGDIKTNSLIGDYPSKDYYKFNITPIFDRICKAKISNFNQRCKNPTSKGMLFYIISAQNIFYSVLSGTDNDDRAFSLLNDLMKENTTIIINEKGKLSFEGINVLKKLHEKYENTMLQQVNKQINEVKKDVQSNIQKVITNLDDVKDIDTKANKIKDGALLFKEGSEHFRRLVWWQDMKFKIFLGLLVAGIIIVLIWR